MAWDIVTKRYENRHQLFMNTAKVFTSHQGVTADPESLSSLVYATDQFAMAVDAMGIADKWDAMLICLTYQKLDQASKQLWEMFMTDTEIPASKTLLEFLVQRAGALSVSQPAKKPVQEHAHHQKPRAFFTNAPQSSKARKCVVCDENHPLWFCITFKAMSVGERQAKVQACQLCANCFSQKHTVDQCGNAHVCHNCKKRQDTLLHYEKKVRFDSNAAGEKNLVQSHFVQSKPEAKKPFTVLPTAQIRVLDRDGNYLLVKAFLDGGSTASFVTESCVNRLGLPRHYSHREVTVMGESTVGRTRGLTTLSFKPHFESNSEVFTVKAFIMSKVTTQLPAATLFSPSKWTRLKNLNLADPLFHVPYSIDIMLGADIFYELLLDGKKKGPRNSPVGTNSKLGWLVGGSTSLEKPTQIQVFNTNVDLHSDLQRFWELESILKTAVYSAEEKACESFFASTHTRDSSGRYVVRIPLKTLEVALGASRDIAVRRLIQVEKRLESRPPVKKLYYDFMQKYIDLGHMEKISPKVGSSRIFLPHHYVVKHAESLEKFRVVFDRSAKTSSGYSSNEAQLVGPTIQGSLITTLMKFRLHPVALPADISKMYRQVLVAPENQEKQYILWRQAPDLEIDEYRLNTVTYGTAAAPFLATRALLQLSKDECEKYPLGAKMVENDFYVDDCMSGTKYRETAVKTIQELIRITASAGFPLRKFASDDSLALQQVPAELRETQETFSMDDESEVVRTLGLHWSTSTDQFMFKVKLEESKRALTKRTLLSEISKIFDPLGWLAPTIILTKILMQDVWREKTEWDEPVPSHIQSRWETCKATLKLLDQLRIPRCMSPQEPESIQLHGFCDASEKAYDAVVYSRAAYLETAPKISLGSQSQPITV